MNNALLYIGGFFVLVLAALFAVPTFVDWNGYRGVFEEQASKVLGRDVRVGGTVNVRLLPAPYVKFEKIRISEIGESSGEPLFRAESFKLWLSVPPLLRGVFEANEIELKRPVLRLAADATGGGNWSTLTFAAGSLPFVPADVALEQMKVINGVLILSGAQGLELANIEGVNGELTSETLEGPFKFKGNVKWEGAEREVRLATARPEPNGDVRFKTTVTVANSKNSYILDGKVADLRSRPRLEGELTAKVTLAFRSPDSGAEEGPAKLFNVAKPAGDAETKGGFDVRGKVVGDTSGFKLQDIALSLEQAGPPQIVTGEASMVWADKVRVNVALGSRWLDLDRAAVNGGGGAKPMEVARGLFEGLTSMLPVEAETNVGLKFDQVNLGSEAVSGVRLAVVRAGGPLELKEFRANVPGGGRLALDGVLSVGQAPATFEGNMSLDGQSLLRFLTWAFKHPGIGEGRTDSAFAVAGRLHLADKSVAIKDAMAEIGALPMRGDLRLDLDARRRLSLTLEGHRIDAGQLFPGSVGLRALTAFKTVGQGDTEVAKDGKAAPAAQPAAGGHLFDATQSDMQLSVRAGQLIDGDRILNNVTAVLSLEGDRLTTETLRFTTDDGLEVDVSGETTDVRRKPAGAMRGIVSATSPAAVKSFFRLLDLDGKGQSAEDRLAELVPFKLAGTVGLGLRTPGAIDVKADGLVDGGRLVTDLRFDAGREDWTASPADITATVEGPRAARTLAALAGGGAVAPGDGIAGASRTLTIKAAGIPAKGLVSIASLKGEGIAVDYSGRITLPADGTPGATGTLRIASIDAREALALAGLPFGAGIANVALDGDVDVAVNGPALTLRPKKLSIGGSTVAGVVTLNRTAGKPINVAAKLDVDQASMPRLLAPLLTAALDRPAAEPVPAVPPPQQRRQTEAPPLASAVLTPGIWPEQVFDLSVIDRVEGNIEARFKALALDEGLNIADARLVAVLEPQRVKVASLDGSALGGMLSSEMTFEKAPAGVGLTGKLRIGVGEAAPGTNEPADAHIASALTLDFSGRALSPAALMADLKGKGEISLGDVTLTGMGPGPVATTVEAALQAKGPSGGAALTEALKAAMKQGQLRLGALKIPVVIGDGAMKLEKVSLETEEGRSTFETAIELATMKIDSEWKIEANVRAKADAAAAKVMLPPVTVVYSGKLKDFAAIEPAVETGALERELTVRKMERNVEELERLRKLDQSRAKQEQDRQKALEAEKAKAAGAATTAATEPPGGPAVPDGAPVPGDGAPAIAPDPEGTAGEADSDTGSTTTDRSGLSSGPPNPAPVKKVRPATTYKRPPGSTWKPFQITPF